MWIERLALTDFRNHASLTLRLGARPVVLAGPNGAGKTNVLEAVSLLSAGQGLRRAAYPELARKHGAGGWAVACTLRTATGGLDIGTGLAPGASSDRTGRIVRINGEPQSGSGVLAEHIEMVWLTPSMDGLFTGAASERRRFLDRLVMCFDPAHGPRSGQFERAMRQRNKLLSDGVSDDAQFAGLEDVMAAMAVAIAAARVEALAGLAAQIELRRARDPNSPFPWATLALDGALEGALGAGLAAVDVEDGYIDTLARTRERDRAAGRTLDGPHRSDLIVGHGPKSMPAHASSTGEQKALLIGLVLAHARLIAEARDGAAPILLLDEIAAHLDERRRSALFTEILALGSQAWMTGTDRAAFASISNDAQFLVVEEGRIAAAA
ncbi:MAG: DNA replication/repair protein RecF [Hyphomicrobiaceae bacterium]